MFLSQEHYAFLAEYQRAETVSEAVRVLWEKYRSTPLSPRRVRLIGEGRVHTSVTVPEYMKESLTSLGKGSFVSGVRLLIEMELLKSNR